VSAVDNATGEPTSGVVLAPGSGSWSSLSDRNLKTGIEPVDTTEVLARVASLPLFEWSYIAQGPGVRHLGPTAQDFRAAFGLGEGSTTISAVDADGVALAAIQELHALVQAQQAQLDAQAAELAALRAQLAGDA